MCHEMSTSVTFWTISFYLLIYMFQTTEHMSDKVGAVGTSSTLGSKIEISGKKTSDLQLAKVSWVSCSEWRTGSFIHWKKDKSFLFGCLINFDHKAQVSNDINQLYKVSIRGKQNWTVADPGRPWSPWAPLPPRFVENMQFSGNFRRKPPIRRKWLRVSPFGVKTPLGPPDQNPGSALDQPFICVAHSCVSWLCFGNFKHGYKME